MASEEKKDANFQRFKWVSAEEKQKILIERNSELTQKKTVQCVKLLNEFLAETGQKQLDKLQNEELPDILENFYVSLQKKKKKNTNCRVSNASELG